MAGPTRVAIILAGGSGERFWPLSTPDRPKQLLSLSGSGASLLQDSVDRARTLFEPGNIFIVTGERIGPAIRDAGVLPVDQVLIEPEAKNTLGAICWAVAELRKRGYSDDSLMAVLTSDHAIGGVDEFFNSVDNALTLASSMDGLVTIGIPPNRPETGFGYIQLGAPVDAGFAVSRFAEKPPLDKAIEYLASGDYLWNSGMFFWRIGAFVRELSLYDREAAGVLDRLSTDPGIFSELIAAPIDRAVMEKSSRVYVVPAEFSWDDIGSWDSLGRTTASDEAGNVAIGEVVTLDSMGNIVYSDHVPVGVIGMSDIIVVATKYGVLVCPKSQAQRVREIVKRLAQPQ